MENESAAACETGGNYQMKTAREKLLATATRLFYKYGINSVGVDEIVRQSGVTKMTLYKHFRSKDALATAFLEQIFKEWSAWFICRVNELSQKKARTPEERVLVIFDALKEWFESPNFRGCPFINTVAELADRNHPARKVAVDFKEKLLEIIRNSLEPLGRDKKELAVPLLLLVDGAIVRATMTDSSEPAKAARKAAASLLTK
jgi:AcrR family transcriptional regulator